MGFAACRAVGAAIQQQLDRRGVTPETRLMQRRAAQVPAALRRPAEIQEQRQGRPVALPGGHARQVRPLVPQGAQHGRRRCHGNLPAAREQRADQPVFRGCRAVRTARREALGVTVESRPHGEAIGGQPVGARPVDRCTGIQNRIEQVGARAAVHDLVQGGVAIRQAEGEFRIGASIEQPAHGVRVVIVDGMQQGRRVVRVDAEGMQQVKIVEARPFAAMIERLAVRRLGAGFQQQPREGKVATNPERAGQWRPAFPRVAAGRVAGVDVGAVVQQQTGAGK